MACPAPTRARLPARWGNAKMFATHPPSSFLNDAPSPSPPFLFDRLLAARPHIPVTILLISANILVFLAMLWQGAGLWHTSNGLQLAWGANFGPATKDGEWWRLGSAMFLHFGLLHLGLNSLSLSDGGRLVERMYGPLRFLALYFTAGLAGNLLSLYAQGEQAVSGGASGAIFGVYGALLSHLWLHRHEELGQEYKRLFRIAVLFCALAIFLGLQIRGIDNFAHIGGFVSGILAGLLLAPWPGLRPSRLLAGGTLLLSSIWLLVHMPEPRYRWSDELRAREEISSFLHTETQIHNQWQQIQRLARQGGMSFEELAGQIETQIAQPYADSFAQLARLQLDPDAPSAATLSSLQAYAGQRLYASRSLVEELRGFEQ